MITDDESMHAAELDMISVADGCNMCFAQRHFVKNLFGKPERRRKESCSLPKKSYLKLLPISLITRSISVVFAAVSSSEDFACFIQFHFQKRKYKLQNYETVQIAIGFTESNSQLKLMGACLRKWDMRIIIVITLGWRNSSAFGSGSVLLCENGLPIMKEESLTSKLCQVFSLKWGPFQRHTQIKLGMKFSNWEWIKRE